MVSLLKHLSSFMYYSSPSDFTFIIAVMQVSDSLRFQNLTQTLEFQYQALANGVAQHADQRRVEREKEKAKAAASAAASWFHIVGSNLWVESGLKVEPFPFYAWWINILAVRSECFILFFDRDIWYGFPAFQRTREEESSVHTCIFWWQAFSGRRCLSLFICCWVLDSWSHCSLRSESSCEFCRI